MDKKKKHSFKSRCRAFAIWQALGYFPWHRPKEKAAGKHSRDFYKGAFDSIPFLNQDAIRTFSHLLLRPGYMIRDYIKGDHERYLAPLTSLIVFYSFFALVAALLQPAEQRRKNFDPDMNVEADYYENPHQAKAYSLMKNTLATVQKGWIYLHLDQYPEEVDTQHETALAALEGTLRSQGIPLFLSQFFFLWLAMALALRRMLFALLLSFGKSGSIGILLMFLLLVWDYHQWLGIGFKQSIRRALATGINYGLLYFIALLLVAGGSFLITYLRT